MSRQDDPIEFGDFYDEPESSGTKAAPKEWFKNFPSAGSMTMLDLVEVILDLSEKSGVDDKFFKKAAQWTEALAKRLNITPLQAVLFAYFVAQGDDDNITLKNIQDAMQCKPVRMLKYISDIDALVKYKLVTESVRYRDKSYMVPQAVIEALRANTAIEIKEPPPLDVYGFFHELEKLVDLCFEHGIDIDAFISKVKRLFECASYLKITQVIKSYHLSENSFALLLLFCERLVNNDDDDIDFDDINRFLNDTWRFHSAKRALTTGESDLIKKELVEPTGADGFENREEFRLTSKAKEEILGELDISLENAKLKRGLILCKDIPEKTLFYNKREGELVEKLVSLLRPDNFKSVEARLSAKGMRTGFACLFYGKPGTGKTETVNMIARKTGRDVMLVDIAATKSCWFGESEKQIKKVFDKYKTYIKVNELAPILLFNEADAVISKRKDIGRSNVAQTENAIQNIILQEMENFTGILIATTNLTQNLDNAFERRFIYKIEFEKPVLEARIKIWKIQLPELDDVQAEILARRFDFTGGEIENIARKRTVDSIIDGGALSLDTIIKYCEDEKLNRDTGGRIGFRSGE